MTQPMGIAAETGRIAVAGARSIVIFANVARLAAHYPCKRDYYDAFFIPRTIRFTGECQMHDMIFEGNAVIGANTNFSCICRVDDNFSFTPLWRPSFISQLRAEDRCHLNGFAAFAGELYYLTALAATDTPGGWRETPHSAGILIDARRNVILRSDLCMPHSPRLINNQLYVLNGGEGELSARRSRQRKQRRHDAAAGLHPRSVRLTTAYCSSACRKIALRASKSRRRSCNALVR